MSDYNITAVTRRKVYSGSAGTGPYAFTFPVISQTDLAVYKNSVKLTLTTDYTVTINSTNGTGSVTLVTAAISTDQITIIGSRTIERTTDFVTAGDLNASALNEQLDSQIIMLQQISEENKRTLKAPVYDLESIEDGGTVNMVLPAASSRAGKVLAFDETTGNPTAGPTISAVTTVANASAAINTVSTNIASVNTVAGNTTNINTVAGISGNVSTVAGISSNVTSVAGNSSNINTVAGISGNVTTVAGISGNVTSVAGNSTNINSVAGNATNINAVNANATNINAVNANSSNINTVAGINTAVSTVATNIASVNSAATNMAAIIDAPNQAAAAASSAAAAAASLQSALWRDVVFKTSANSPITIAQSDNGKLYCIDTSGGNVVVNLPSIAGLAMPFNVSIKKETADSNSITINRYGTDTIDGATSKQVQTPASGTTLLADLDPSPDQWIAADFGAAAGNMVSDIFSGNGSTTAFTLSASPGSANNVHVFISGVRQRPVTDYLLSGTTLTFTSAPPSGTNNIFALSGTTLSIGTPADGTVSYAKMTTGHPYWDTSGNVGIGTTSPWSGMTVVKDNGSGYIAGFRKDVSSSWLAFQTYATTPTLQGLTSNLGAVADIALQVTGGNVGIGTSSPNAKLNIYSGSSTANLTQWNGSTTDANFITIAKSGTTGATAGTPQFSLGMDYSTTYTDLCAIKFARDNGAGGNMQFFTNVNANGTERMRIDSSGNVGIGTSSPATKLHVFNTSAVITEMRAGNSVSYASLLVDATGASQLYAPGGTQIFNVNGAERMRIDSSGIITGAAGNLMLVQGTAVNTTSGVAQGFTGIPSWVKRITFMLNGVSTTGTSPMQIQIGSGSYTTTGYSSCASGSTGSLGSLNSTTGFVLTPANIAAASYHGGITISLVGTNAWTSFGILGQTGSAGSNMSGGAVTLSGALDRIQITTVGGTDTFDAGSINIQYE